MVLLLHFPCLRLNYLAQWERSCRLLVLVLIRRGLSRLNRQLRRIIRLLPECQEEWERDSADTSVEDGRNRRGEHENLNNIHNKATLWREEDRGRETTVIRASEWGEIWMLLQLSEVKFLNNQHTPISLSIKKYFIIIFQISIVITDGLSLLSLNKLITIPPPQEWR